MRLEGKRILVTGASSGIGRALAWELAHSGASLALAARTEYALIRVSQELASAYPHLATPIAIRCDVRDRNSVGGLVETCIQCLGGIDVLVNNAGVSVYGETAKTSMEDLRGVMDVNFFGAVNCILEILPHMRTSGHGLIVNVASVAAIHGVPYLGAYGASKAALVAFGQSLRAELKGHGIAVMNVFPDYTDTELFSHEKKIGGARRPQPPYASATHVAKEIVRAIELNRRNLILSPQGKALFKLQGLCPVLVEKKMQMIANELRENEECSHA
jgi:short-subunit dehydrogenase